MLQWSNIDDCSGALSGVLDAFGGSGDKLGWSDHGSEWDGVYTRGKHFNEGPFNDDHWIIIRRLEARTGQHRCLS